MNRAASSCNRVVNASLRHHVQQNLLCTPLDQRFAQSLSCQVPGMIVVLFCDLTRVWLLLTCALMQGPRHRAQSELLPLCCEVCLVDVRSYAASCTRWSETSCGACGTSLRWQADGCEDHQPLARVAGSCQAVLNPLESVRKALYTGQRARAQRRSEHQTLETAM